VRTEVYTGSGDVDVIAYRLTEVGGTGSGDLEDGGRAKRPTVWYEHVEIDIRMTPDGADDTDVAPA
jgi:predicted transcriptional regulator